MKFCTLWGTLVSCEGDACTFSEGTKSAEKSFWKGKSVEVVRPKSKNAGNGESGTGSGKTSWPKMSSPKEWESLSEKGKADSWKITFREMEIRFVWRSSTLYPL